MINEFTKKRIKTLFLADYPKLVVQQIIDWDKDRYVVVAPHKGRTDELDPYYSVNKHNGEIRPFYVGEDIVKFARLVKES